MDFGKASYLNSGKALPKLLRDKLGEPTTTNWSATELQEELYRASRAVVEVQKQIQRGEETYYEGSQTYGGHNIFQSWEGYIDAREMGVAVVRRQLPQEHRWFSSTCHNIQGFAKPYNMGDPLPSDYGKPVTVVKKEVPKEPSIASTSTGGRKRQREEKSQEDKEEEKQEDEAKEEKEEKGKKEEDEDNDNDEDEEEQEDEEEEEEEKEPKKKKAKTEPKKRETRSQDNKRPTRRSRRK